MTAVVELTEDQLRAAWAVCRKPTWPATFEETMEDPVLSRLVQLTAKHPPRAARPPREEPGRVPRTPRETTWRALQSIPPGIDRKRAASGERDDD